MTIIKVRNMFSDIEIFKQIFINREYDCNFPHAIETILDLGANIGLASVFFRDKYPEASIALVEPVSESLIINSQGNDFYCYYAGIGTEPGFCRVNLPDGEPYAMSVRTELTEQYASDTIPVITVQQVMDACGWSRISLLKCDIEGAEDDLFTKNNQWLEYTDAVIVELHEYIKPGVVGRVTNALSEYGIHWVANKGENAIYVRKQG